jgi:alpha-beta hydrolase superfamily lysophospholipase
MAADAAAAMCDFPFCAAPVRLRENALIIPRESPPDRKSMSLAQHSELNFEGYNGIKLFSQSWVPAGTRKSTLLIVHGLHDYSGRYEWAAEELAKQGYAVYAFDLRGHGKSEGKRQSIESSQDYLEDLRRFIQLVKGKETGKPLFLFGFSLGGNIVGSYALENKNDVDGVIMVGAALKPNRSGAAIAIGKFLMVTFPNMGVARVTSKDFSRDPGVVASLEKDPMIYKEPTPGRTILWILRSGEKLQKRAKGFDKPVLLLHGTADALAPAEGSKFFCANVGSSDKTLKLYEGFFHDLLHETGKQTVLNDISEWLRKHS